jgi:hypothetical protein
MISQPADRKDEKYQAIISSRLQVKGMPVGFRFKVGWLQAWILEHFFLISSLVSNKA